MKNGGPEDKGDDVIVFYTLLSTYSNSRGSGESLRWALRIDEREFCYKSLTPSRASHWTAYGIHVTPLSLKRHSKKYCATSDDSNLMKETYFIYSLDCSLRVCHHWIQDLVPFDEYERSLSVDSRGRGAIHAHCVLVLYMTFRRKTRVWAIVSDVNTVSSVC